MEGVTLPSSLIRAHAPDQNPPLGFTFRYSKRSLQVTVSPCWKLALPDIISTILAWLFRPLSRGVFPVRLPVSTRKTSASPQSEKARHAKFLCNATSTEGNFRDCSHSLMFKPPCLLGLQVAPTSVFFHRAARPFTPRIPRLVTCPGLWHRYMPESGNWHDGTFTRWTTALPAAPHSCYPGSPSIGSGSFR